MMKFLTLSQIPLLSLWGINRMIKSKDSKEKRKLFFMLAVIPLIGFSFLPALASSLNIFAENGFANKIPAICLLSSVGICFILTLLSTNGFLFSYKDYDSIMSLPVSTAEVVASRLFVIYITCQIYVLPIVLTGHVVYFVTQPFSLIYCSVFVATIFFAPIIPMALAAVIGTVIAFFSSKLRIKNAVYTILLMAISLGIFYISFSYSWGGKEISETETIEVFKIIADTTESLYPPSHWISLAVGGNPFALLVFLTTHILVGALLLIIISALYKGINTRIMSQTKRKKFVFGKIGESSPFMSLYKKDLKRFFKSPIFVMNMGFVPVLLIVLSVAFLFVPTETILGLFDLDMSANEALPLITKISPFIISAFLSASIISAPLISLEGKNLWILKSIPVKYETIYFAKMAVQLTVTWVSAFISAAAICVVFPLSYIQMLFVFITSAVHCALMAEIGIFIGLSFANYDWTSEVTVIKQNIGIFFCMIIGFLLSVVPIPIVFVLGEQPFIAVYTLFILILTCLIHIINRNKKM